MRKSRFNEEQMVAILREADKTSVAAAAKKNNVSEQTLYAWRKHFGESHPSDVKRLKALEAENAKFKKLLAERVSAFWRLICSRRSTAESGEPAGASFLQERGLSARRACGLVGLARSGLAYDGFSPPRTRR